MKTKKRVLVLFAGIFTLLFIYPVFGQGSNKIKQYNWDIKYSTLEKQEHPDKWKKLFEAIAEKKAKAKEFNYNSAVIYFGNEKYTLPYEVYLSISIGPLPKQNKIEKGGNANDLTQLQVMVKYDKYSKDPNVEEIEIIYTNADGDEKIVSVKNPNLNLNVSLGDTSTLEYKGIKSHPFNDIICLWLRDNMPKNTGKNKKTNDKFTGNTNPLKMVTHGSLNPKMPHITDMVQKNKNVKTPNKEEVIATKYITGDKHFDEITNYSTKRNLLNWFKKKKRQVTFIAKKTKPLFLATLKEKIVKVEEKYDNFTIWENNYIGLIFKPKKTSTFPQVTSKSFVYLLAEVRDMDEKTKEQLRNTKIANCEKNNGKSDLYIKTIVYIQQNNPLDQIDLLRKFYKFNSGESFPPTKKPNTTVIPASFSTSNTGEIGRATAIIKMVNPTNPIVAIIQGRGRNKIIMELVGILRFDSEIEQKKAAVKKTFAIMDDLDNYFASDGEKENFSFEIEALRVRLNPKFETKEGQKYHSRAVADFKLALKYPDDTIYINTYEEFAEKYKTIKHICLRETSESYRSYIEKFKKEEIDFMKKRGYAISEVLEETKHLKTAGTKGRYWLIKTLQKSQLCNNAYKYRFDDR